MSVPRFRVLPRVQDAAPSKRSRELNKYLTVLAFLLPGLTVLVLFMVIPVAQSARYSTYRWNGFGPLEDFVGMANYEQAFNHNIFRMAVSHSLLIVVLSLAIQLPMALGLALLVGRGRLPGKGLFRTAFFVPYVFSEVVTAVIWEYVYNPRQGLVNVVLGTIIPGYTNQALLGHPNTVMFAIFAVLTWKYFGVHMILYMAGLQAIPSELEDAARIDGATELQVLRWVTLPLLGSTIRLTVYLSVLGSLQQFIITWSLTEGGPVNSSELIVTYLYKFGIQRFQLGFGSAIALILFAMTLLFSLGYQRTIMRQDYAEELA